MTGRLLRVPDVAPHDLAAEQAVLGAVFLSDHALDGTLEERVRPEQFYRSSHEHVFRAMLELHRTGEPVDPLTVKAQLDRTAKLGKTPDGPLPTVGELDLLAATVPAVGHLRGYCRRVVELAGWRARLQAAAAQLEAVASLDEDAYQAAGRELVAVEEQADPATLATPEQLGDEFYDWYMRPEQHPTIPLPFDELTDALLGGAHPGDTTVIAGWSGMGKSTFGDQWLEHVKDTAAMRCCLYPNEMGRIHRTGRLLAARAGVDFTRLMKRALSTREAGRVLEELQKLPFAMQPAAGWTEADIARHLRRHRWDLAMVDRADLIPNGGKVEDYDRISRGLAVAAREAGTHLILTVQLNRARDTSSVRPAPVLRDLRGTGAWEQDARNVLFVHRNQEEGAEGVARTYDDGHIRLAKASNGAEALVDVLLNTQSMRFVPKPRDFDPVVDRPAQDF